MSPDPQQDHTTITITDNYDPTSTAARRNNHASSSSTCPVLAWIYRLTVISSLLFLGVSGLVLDCRPKEREDHSILLLVSLFTSTTWAIQAFTLLAIVALLTVVGGLPMAARRSTPETPGPSPLPLLRIVSIHFGLNGLALVICSCYCMQRRSSPGKIPPLYYTFIGMGMALVALSSLSVMLSFWKPTQSNAVRSGAPLGDTGLQTPLLVPGVNEEDIDDDESSATGLRNVEDYFDPTSPPSRLTGISRFWQFIFQSNKSVLLSLYSGCIVLLIRLPLSLAIPHFVSTTLGALSRENYRQAEQQILMLLVVGTMDAVLDFWCIFLFGYTNQQIVYRLRCSLFAKLLQMEIGYFDHHSSSQLSSRLSTDCSEMANDLTWFFRFSIESFVRVVGIISYMLYRSPPLAACALSIIPFVAVINQSYGRWLARNSSHVQDALASANAVAQEALLNVRTVIASAAEPQEQERYKEKIQQHYELTIRQLYMTGIYYMSISTFLINTVVQASLLYLGSHFIEQGRLTTDILLAFMLYQGQLQSETMNLFQSYTSLIKSSGAGAKVFSLLDRDIPPPGTGGLENRNDEVETRNISVEDQERTSLDNTVGVNIEFRHVRFRYPTRIRHVIFKDLSFEIPAGKTVALVGGSGCGKTTIVNLLQRFYDPEEGSIFIDGQNLREIDLIRYRHEVGVVTQDPTLFDGSILDNILYGSPGATREEAIEAARVAHANVFCEAIGYDTMTGERGVTLSGGQRQRIVLARALVRKPRLLLLDEATSALDTESERLVQNALDALTQASARTTTVIIAHRLHTVRKADIIMVVSSGDISETGSHEELMSRNGEYARMIAQANEKGVFS